MLTETLLATSIVLNSLLVSAVQETAEAEAKLRARAMQIHFDALTLDTHKDIRASLAPQPRSKDPARAAEELRRDDPRLWGPNQVDFPKMRAGGLVNARRQADSKFDAIERIAASGRPVACIGIENGYAVGEDTRAIADFQRRG